MAAVFALPAAAVAVVGGAGPAFAVAARCGCPSGMIIGSGGLVRTSFGGFAHWRRGYATTLAHRTKHITVERDVVRLTLVATDRTPCGGTTVQRFAVTWRLTGGQASTLSATRPAGEVPAAAC